MKNFLLFVLVSVLLSSCLQQQDESSATGNEENLTQPGIVAHELEQYDIEEIASVYQEFSIPVNHIYAATGSTIDQGNGLLPPPDHKKREHIRNLLRGLLEGPCLKHASVVFDRIIESVQKRILFLSSLLIRSTEPLVIEKIKQRIELLEDLEKKLYEKKEDCADGISECTENFKTRLTHNIEELSITILELEKKILDEQDPVKKEHLEKVLEKTSELKTRLQEVLSRC